MTLTAAQLLKRLEPAVRTHGPAIAPAPHAAIEGQSFDELLAQAARGSISSGRQIELKFEAAPPLEPSQLERLADAADLAEAAGASTALMLIDGRAFVLDVRSRCLMSEMSAGSATQLHTIDAAVQVASAEGASHLTTLGPPPATVLGRSALPHAYTSSAAA